MYLQTRPDLQNALLMIKQMLFKHKHGKQKVSKE